MLYGQLLNMLTTNVKYSSPSEKEILRFLHWNSTTSITIHCVRNKNKESSYNMIFNENFQCVNIYITTVCTSDGYASGYFINTLCYIFGETHWKYNHLCTVWRGGFIILNSRRSGNWWQIWWQFSYAIIK